MLRSNKKDLYIVPDLPIKEIIDYYAEIDIDIRPNDITKPTMISTLKLFDTLLELYKGERTCDLLMKHRNEEDFVEFEDSLYVISIYRRMSEFLKKIGVQAFCLRNITQPEPKKLISILSVVVNFSMYRDNKRELYERVNGAIGERERIRSEVVGKIKKAEENLKKLESEVIENENTKRSLEKEISQLESELREAYKVQRGKASEVEKLREEKTVFCDKLSSSQLLALNTKQEIACLKTQVVSDPEKLLELLNEMRSMIFKEKESIKVLQQRKYDLCEKINKFENAIEKIKKLNKTAVASQNEEKKSDLVQKETQEIESQIKGDESKINSLKIKLGHINRQISHLESKVLNLQDSDKKCAGEIAEELESLKINYEKVSDERNVINSKALENMKECKHIEFETFKLRNTHENELTDMRSKLCELKDFIFRYTGILKQYLGD